MTEIKYIVGDLFEAISGNDKRIVIPHIVNSVGGWGSGFVLPLAKHFPMSEQEYRKWYKDGEIESYGDIVPFQLGKVQFVYGGRCITIANMVGQEGTGLGIDGRPPIRYSALAECMQEVAENARVRRAEIHAPKFGSGLSGGDWSFIEELIKECWCDCDIPVTIYSLEEAPIVIALDPNDLDFKPNFGQGGQQPIDIDADLLGIKTPDSQDVS